MNIRNLLAFDKLTKLRMSALPGLKKEVFLFLANLAGQLSLRAEVLCQYTVQSLADLSEVGELSPKPIRLLYTKGSSSHAQPFATLLFVNDLVKPSNMR